MQILWTLIYLSFTAYFFFSPTADTRAKKREDKPDSISYIFKCISVVGMSLQGHQQA